MSPNHDERDDERTARTSEERVIHADAARSRDLADAMPHIVWTTGVGGEVTTRIGFGARTACTAGTSRAVYRFRHENGVVTEWVATATDVDDQQRTEREQQFLVEASRVLGTSLELEKTMADVARLVVPHLADWCAIDLADENGIIGRPAMAHVDPTKVAAAWEFWRLMPPKPEDAAGVSAVVRTQKPENNSEIPDALLAEAIADPKALALIRSLGLRSSMCVPIVLRGRALGALTLVTAESGRTYDTRNLAFAEEFARRIAVAVDNARLYEAMKAAAVSAEQARAAAEAVAADVVEQSRLVEVELRAMRTERDAALARLKKTDLDGH